VCIIINTFEGLALVGAAVDADIGILVFLTAPLAFTNIFPGAAPDEDCFIISTILGL